MIPKRKKKKRIPYQQRRLIKEVLSGKHKTITSAGKAAGYTHATHACDSLKHLQASLPELMSQLGLSDFELIENSLKPMLNAISRKKFQHNGKILYAEPEENWSARAVALDMAWRLKGSYAPLAVEQAHKHKVEVLVLNVPRPPRDEPIPMEIEIANKTKGENDAE